MVFTAVHEHETIYVPELHTVPVAVGTDTHIKLKWELREKLNNPYGDCLEDENEVGRLKITNFCNQLCTSPTRTSKNSDSFANTRKIS